MAWIARVEATAALARFNALAERTMTTRGGAERRALYGEMGLDLTDTTYAGDVLRKGPMSVT